MSFWRPAVLIGLLPFVMAAAAHARTFSDDVDLFEYRLGSDHNLLFDGSLAYGGDTEGFIAKLVTDGAGRKINQIQGEVDYSRAIGGGFDLVAGARHEFGSHPHISYGVLGLSGEPEKGVSLESYAVVSTGGVIFGEFKAIYD